MARDEDLSLAVLQGVELVNISSQAWEVGLQLRTSTVAAVSKSQLISVNALGFHISLSGDTSRRLYINFQN